MRISTGTISGLGSVIDGAGTTTDAQVQPRQGHRARSLNAAERRKSKDLDKLDQQASSISDGHGAGDTAHPVSRETTGLLGARDHRVTIAALAV